MAGGLLATAALLTGCGLRDITQAANQATLDYEVKEKVARLVVVGGAGDIVISEAAGNVVTVSETLHWSSSKPTTEHHVDGDALVMTYDCPHAMDNCSVDYKVHVPKGMRTELETGSGDIHLRALSNPIKVKVGSGNLEGAGLTGTDLTVEAGSGDTTLKYATAPDSIDLLTGSGTAKITLPGGPYDVDAEAKSGDVTVSVTTDQNSPHKVVARAGSGDVSLLPA
ncbi:lipoprotein [Microbispora sp. NBRC 16548]|nr:lipoprotein [Microbispora sp. NBRC 16548]